MGEILEKAVGGLPVEGFGLWYEVILWLDEVMFSRFFLSHGAFPTFLIKVVSAVFLFFSVGTSMSYAEKDYSVDILKVVDVAPVWSVHQIGSPQLVTAGEYQYVAYYDHDRFLTLAQRRLGSENWTFQRFPVQMGWATGSHAQITLAVDRDGFIHLNSYRRSLTKEPPNPPMAIYYRSEMPHSMASFERLYMVSEEEHPHYPTFYSVGEKLFFTYREGRSGRGNQRINRYLQDEQRWIPVFEQPLLDGGGEMNAYVHGPGGPIPGPDGRWHLLWVWRNTPCHSTNHSLSYARTVGYDLDQWETAAGEPVTSPFSIKNSELLVDGTPPEGGLSNVLFRMNWDSQGRSVISYHKFDENGYSQIYNARFVDGEWKAVQATDWDYVYGDEYFGRGALNVGSHIRVNAVQPAGPGELTQIVWNREVGGRMLVLDEETLQPLREERSPPRPAWRRTLARPDSDFQVEPIEDLRRIGGNMIVQILSDNGSNPDPNSSFYLRWEHAGANRDMPVPKPWPEPSMLRVVEVGRGPTSLWRAMSGGPVDGESVRQ